MRHRLIGEQTGNVIFMSLGAVGIKNQYYDPARSIVALASFWYAARTISFDLGVMILKPNNCSFGSFVTGRLAIQFGAKNRIYLFVTFFIQSLILIGCAILLFTETVKASSFISGHSPIELVIVFPLAIVFGAQVAISRPFGIPAIPTGTLGHKIDGEKLTPLPNRQRL